MTVYGNNDGFMGRRTADGTRYTPDAWWVAYNYGPKGSVWEVTCKYTCKKGHTNLNIGQAPKKDVMRSDKKIDATIRFWKHMTWCATCKKAMPYGKHDVTVRRVK